MLSTRALARSSALYFALVVQIPITHAHADDRSPLARPESPDGAAHVLGVSADPNTPRFGLMWRGSMRAQLGAALPLIGRETTPGFAWSLAPLVELHEPSGSHQVLPSQYWRARVAVALSQRWNVGADHYRARLTLDHESDHETAHAYSRPGFLTQNAVTIGGGGQWELGALRLDVSPALRLDVLSCTRDRERCKDFEGESSIGAQLDITLAAPGWDLASLIPFISVSGLAIAEHDRVRSEAHVALHMGLWCTTPALVFQIFALTYFGNDVGITRAQRVAQIGIGLSLSPR